MRVVWLLLLVGVAVGQESGTATGMAEPPPSSSGLPAPECDDGYVVHESECVACEPGFRWSNDSGVLCLACEVGTYSAEEASLECTPCAVGKYANTTEATECLPCEPGTFANETGTANCLPCEFDKVSPGLSECVDESTATPWLAIGLALGLSALFTLVCYKWCTGGKMKLNPDKKDLEGGKESVSNSICYDCCCGPNGLLDICTVCLR